MALLNGSSACNYHNAAKFSPTLQRFEYSYHLTQFLLNIRVIASTYNCILMQKYLVLLSFRVSAL